MVDDGSGSPPPAPETPNGAVAAVATPAPPPPTEPAAAADEAPERGGRDSVGMAITAVFWALIIAVAAFFFFRTETADVLLDVATGQAFVMKGAVLYHGEPVRNGQVQLAITRPKDQQYIASVVVPVSAADGTFADRSTPPPPGDAAQALQVTAHYLGRSTAGKSIVGDATVWLNFSPPLGRLTLWGTLAGTTVLALLLITLFTGELTRRKARVLFGLTYLMTFVSIAAPIALTMVISRNYYLVEMMQAAPIGLVKGTAKGVDTAQWLLNIGGAVTKAARPAAAGTAPAAGGATTPPAPSAAAVPAGAADPARAAAAAEGVAVVGGLAVPFYVVFLAMLGAGINMTIQVPKIQNTYDILDLPKPRTGVLTAALQAPLMMFADSKPPSPAEAQARSGIRRDLIGNYMYLLSAPFLAIAVYYLLQIIASNTAEPVLVLMAFATGLVSDRIISRITKFAQDTLGSGQEP